jgi:hypothetical protein
MKIQITEFKGSFRFDIEAETVAEAAQLARLATNATKELQRVEAYALLDCVLATISIGRRARPTSCIQKAK